MRPLLPFPPMMWPSVPCNAAEPILLAAVVHSRTVAGVQRLAHSATFRDLLRTISNLQQHLFTSSGSVALQLTKLLAAAMQCASTILHCSDGSGGGTEGKQTDFSPEDSLLLILRSTGKDLEMRVNDAGESGI